jgi:hypothetical protein
MKEADVIDDFAVNERLPSVEAPESVDCLGIERDEILAVRDCVEPTVSLEVRGLVVRPLHHDDQRRTVPSRALRDVQDCRPIDPLPAICQDLIGMGCCTAEEKQKDGERQPQDSLMHRTSSSFERDRDFEK